MTSDDLDRDNSRYTSSENESDPDSDDPSGLKYDIKRLVEMIGEYLDGKRLHPLWEPVEVQDDVPAWNVSDHPRLKALRMLQLPSGGSPDMVMYQLGRLDTLDPSLSERMDDVLSGTEHVYVDKTVSIFLSTILDRYLSNASGTGKTRMSFEILSRRWGIYLTSYASYASDPYGSMDVGEAVSAMTSSWGVGSEFTFNVALSTRLSQTSRDALQENRHIAHFVFRRLILARLLIFKEFHNLVTQRRIPEDEARLKWLMIQLRPAVLLVSDVFQQIFLGLRNLDDDELTPFYGSIPPELVSLLSCIVIDEAQVLLHTYRSAFAVDNNHSHAPVLRELVICLGNDFPHARLVLSGVQFDLAVVSEALRASASAQKSVRHYHSFGHFDSIQRCSAYLRHFLGDDLPDDNCELVYQWLHGRHRVIAVLVMLTLRFGARNIIRVMDNLLYRLTGYQRPGFSFLRSYLVTGFRTIIKDEQAEESPAALVFRKSVLTYTVHGLPTITTAHSRTIVHLALALYTHSANEAVIFEPFIFLSLARWLASSTQYGFQGIIRRRRGTDGNAAYTLHSVAFIEGLAPSLMEAFRTAPALDAAVLFPAPRPPWACHAARVVLPRLAEHSSRFSNVHPESQALRLIRSATTSADVFAWLNHASQPFLIPDPDFGADLLFMLEVHDASHVLVCVHADPFPSTRARRHSRVVPPSPKDFYKTDPEAYEQLIAVLDSLTRVPLARGKRAKTRQRLAKYNTLHLLCFERPYREEAYDPPVGNINFEYLLELSPPPPELSFADLHDIISCTPAPHC